MAGRMIQYYAYNKREKIIRGPFIIPDDPRQKDITFGRETSDDPEWIGGSLYQILRDPDVDRQDVARALGLKKD